MASTWSVVQQQPLPVDVGGTRVPGVRVTFQYGEGQRDFVEVPNDTYADPEKVRAAIAARIAQHEAVAALSSGA